jgi:hypothetical protein
LGARLAPLGAVAALAIGTVACNAVIDIGDIEFEDTVANGGAGGTSTGTGTTTGTGGSGGSATGGGGSGGEAAGTPGGEYCINGIDDDDDGDVDCADSDCTAFQCMPAPPTDWNGPAVLYVGVGTDPVPDCAGAWQNSRDLGDGLTVPAHSCSNCSCGSPSGGACTLSTLTVHNTSNCGGGTQPVTPASRGTCTPFTALDGNDGMTASTVSMTSAGSCSASGGALTAPPVTWDTAGKLCSGAPEDAGGCDGSSVCAPAPVAPFGTAVCIWQAGDTATCPPEYPNQTVLSGGVDDGRACSACSCSAPSGRSCSGTMSVYEGGTCAGTAIDVPTNGSTCVPLSIATTSASLISNYSLSGGSCNASGGAATGSATALNPRTICCAD